MKDTITTDEIITFLEGCKQGASMKEGLLKLDSSLTSERVYYLQNRIQLYLKEAHTTPYIAMATVLKEEAPMSAGSALIMFGFASYLMGKNQISQKLETLADKMVALTVMKESLNKILNDKPKIRKRNRSSKS